MQWFIPLWSATVFNTVVYLAIGRRLALLGDVEEMSARHSCFAFRNLFAFGPCSQRLVRRMRFYPLAMVVVNLPAVVNTLYQAATGGDLEMGLIIVQVLFGSAQGLLNAIVYGCTPAVRQELARLWRERSAQAAPVLAVKGARSSDDDGTTIEL